MHEIHAPATPTTPGYGNAHAPAEQAQAQAVNEEPGGVDLSMTPSDLFTDSEINDVFGEEATGAGVSAGAGSASAVLTVTA